MIADDPSTRITDDDEAVLNNNLTYSKPYLQDKAVLLGPEQ